MKKVIVIASVVCALLFASCAADISDKRMNANGLYGSLSVNNSERAIKIDDLAFCKVMVSGKGIAAGEEPTSGFVTVNEGKGSATIQNIPVGKNKIVTGYAYDGSKGKLGTTLVRNIVDISAGANNCQLNGSTTALGNVFYKLNTDGYDISSVSDSQLQSIKNAISSEVSWALIDSDSIASDFKKGSLKASGSYILSSATASFSNNLGECTIQIGDPVSEVKNVSANGSGTITNIAPGTWPVYLIQNGSIVKKTYAEFKKGQTTDLGTFGSVTDKIIVHVEVSTGYSKVYAWTGSSTKVFGDWPGKAMTDSDNDGWYDVVIELTSVKLIFNGNGQTADLTREAGEWWYKNGTWTDYNPNDSTAPELVSFTANKTSNVSGNVTFTVSASDNIGLKSAVISTGKTVLKTISLTGKNCEESFVWDSNDLENGSYKIDCVVYDTSDNVSSEILSVNLSINNENLPPVAVISGAGRVAPNAESIYSAADSYDKHGTVTAYQWTVSGGATIVSGATSEECKVSFPAVENSECFITLKVKDAEGVWSESVTKKVTVKTHVSNDFREETIYFLMTARWYDGDESNNRYTRPDDAKDTKTNNRANDDPPWRGDFKGLIEKLDYIKAMGFTAVWITPPVLNRSDYDFHGYHAWNMNKIDPRLESAGATYQDLIDACHEKGLKIIQDIVLNHSCRFGLEDLQSVKYFGARRDDIVWGSEKTKGSDYYDEYNPDFTYNGLDFEPKSGHNYYNGDLWQEEVPNLPWNPNLTGWGTYVNDGAGYYKFQWPGTIKPLVLLNPEYFHQRWLENWEDETCQSGHIHDDCIDLNTESAATQKYLIDAYSRYIEMGVDAFRVDTVKHISRVMFNRRFNPAFMEAARNAGNENFYMFGECCTKVNEVWNKNNPSLSAPFYTWKESETWSADDSEAVHECYEANHQGTDNQPTSNNHYLIGNTYHKPDYSQKSDLGVIDFAMHMNFTDAGNAYGMRGNDKWYNDATWNVTYVESHDYSPDNGPKNDHDIRCTADDDEWAEDLSLLWTFRGIPCLFQGSEIRFKAGVQIDVGPNDALENTGRAYFGHNLEGTLTATDFSEYTGAEGKIAETMNYPLVKHLRDLNKIRRAIPALQKGQYSNDDCNGNMCFKRRYTDDEVDSFVVVTISSNATFNNLPGGTYVDVITGDKKVISEGGSITTSGCSGQGNLRVYVNTSLKGCSVSGKIAGYSPFLK